MKKILGSNPAPIHEISQVNFMPIQTPMQSVPILSWGKLTGGGGIPAPYTSTKITIIEHVRMFGLSGAMENVFFNQPELDKLNEVKSQLEQQDNMKQKEQTRIIKTIKPQEKYSKFLKKRSIFLFKLPAY